MFTCRNQSCGADWTLFGCRHQERGPRPHFHGPMCGAHNYVERHDAPNGGVSYEQIIDIDPKTKR